jgi:hypothetical protein
MIAAVFHLANIFHMQSPFDPLHSDGYQFWSGIGSDLGEAGIIIAALAWWKHHNCQVGGCWRLHLRTPTGGGHFVCKRHHPAHEGDALSADYIAQAHHAAVASMRASGAHPVMGPMPPEVGTEPQI